MEKHIVTAAVSYRRGKVGQTGCGRHSGPEEEEEAEKEGDLY